MKRESVPASKGLLLVYRTVIVLFLSLMVVLAAGSLYGIIRAPDSGPLLQIGRAAGGETAEHSGGGTGQAGVFTGIGRLRIPAGVDAGASAGAEQAVVVILSITFPYPAEDRLFAEELDSRAADFRSMAVEYFSSLPREQILTLDEEAAKTEITRRYNAVLRLGKIVKLYFNDLMIIE